MTWDGRGVTNLVPLAPPTEILTVQVTGDAAGLTALASGDPVQPTTSLKWFIDGVLVETTRSQVYRFTEDSVGAALDDNLDYSISVQPTNVVGDGTLSAAVPGRLNQGVSAETVLGYVVAGFVLAGSIQVGSMTIDPDTGITIPLANGGLIQFPADGSDAIITAILRARSLVVENNLRIQGTLNAIEGGLQLANGTSAPTVKPRAGTSWDHAAAYLAADVPLGTVRGLYDAGTAWVITESFLGDGKIWSIDKTTGVRSQLGSTLTGLQPFGGITKVGTDWYVLVQPVGTFEWWVRKYNSSWVFQSQWQRATSIPNNQMALATDGTFLYTTHRSSAGVLIVDRYSLTGTGATNIFTSTVAPGSAVTGLYVGSADFGATRYVITCGNGVYVFNSSGTRQTSQDWARANGETIFGIAWDATRFHTLGADKVWHYSTVVTATSRSITYTWYDNDAAGTGTHETQASPALTYSQAPRQWLRIDTDPPSFAGFPDDPNAVRLYVANQRQADLGTGVTMAVYDVPATGGSAAPTSNGFSGVSAPGSMTSGATDGTGALINLSGAGSGRTGWNQWSAAGNLQGTAGLRSSATNQTGIADSTWTKVTLTGTASYNEGLSVASSEVTIAIAGLYRIDADLAWLNDSATNRRIAAIEAYTGTDPGVGSGTTLDRDECVPSTSAFVHGKPSTTEWLAAGTKVRLIVWQNSGSNRTIQNSILPSKFNVARCG